LKEKTKRIKVLIAKTSIDAHWVGPMLVTMALRDAGMEVVHGRQLTSEEIVQTAIQEDVDVIGLNLCGRYNTVSEVMAKLKERHMEDRLVIAGGVIPQEDIPYLKGMGINETFPPGSSLNSIVSYIRENVSKKRKTSAEKSN
jgi:methylmalonyl-CoA mutase C-terminal domain/subunit